MTVEGLIALGALVVSALSLALSVFAFFRQDRLRQRIDKLDLQEREAKAELATRPELFAIVETSPAVLIIENIGGVDACQISLSGHWEGRGGAISPAIPEEEELRIPLSVIRPNTSAAVPLEFYREVNGPPLHLRLSWQNPDGETFKWEGPVEF